MSGILPNFPDWRQFDTLAIWQLAALMNEVDPRAWAMGDVVGRDGDALDLSTEQDQLISGIHAGTLQPGKYEEFPPTKNTVVNTDSARQWLRTHGYAELADNLDRSLHAPKPENLVKKAVLVKRHERAWPSIQEDLKRAGTNGLSVAHTGNHGFWNEALAMDWAEKNGKLTNSGASGIQPQSFFPT